MVASTLAAGWVPGQNQYTIDRPEGTRYYYVWVPKAYNGSSAVPVVFGFHGLGDLCTDFATETGFTAVSEAHNFIFVYPCGSTGLLGTAWNAGTCCLRWESVDDVQFTLDIISALKTNFNVNPSQIFSFGFSNGAMFSEILACKQGSILAGIASVSGVVELDPGNQEGLTECDTAFASSDHAVPVLHVHGTSDPLVPWNGDGILGFPPIPDDFTRWASRSTCEANSTVAWTKGAYKSHQYTQCKNGATIELIEHDGGVHEWPSDGDFDTTSYVWQFFNNIIQKQNEDEADSESESDVEVEPASPRVETAIA